MSNLIYVLPVLIALAGLQWLYKDMRTDWQLRPITGTIGLAILALVIITGTVMQ